MFPAPAGMSPIDGMAAVCEDNVPRTRGDEPRNTAHYDQLTICSPHPRG